MGEKGQVIKLNPSENTVTVRMTRQEACAKCGACKAGFTEQEMIIYAKNICKANVDDWVIIDLESSSFLKAVLIMYGIPFLFMCLGLFIGVKSYYLINFNISKDLYSFIIGIIFVVVSFMLINSKEESWKKQNFSPSAVKIVN